MATSAARPSAPASRPRPLGRTPRPRRAAERRAPPGAGPCPLPGAALRTGRRRRFGPPGTNVPSARLHATRPEARAWRACAALRSASASTTWVRRLELAGHLGRPGHSTSIGVAVVAGEAVQLLAQRGVGGHGPGVQRPRQRLRRSEGGAELLGRAGALGRAELGVGAEHERHPEQPLHHTVVHLTGEVDPLRRAAASARARPWPCARWRPARRSCPASTSCAARVGQVERPAAAVGEDHAQPAPAGRHRRAGERGEPGELRVARGDLMREVARRRPPRGPPARARWATGVSSSVP